MPNTFSDPYAAFAFQVGLAAIGLTLLLVLAIVSLRIRLRTNLRREQIFIAIWRPLLLKAVSDDHSADSAVALPVLRAGDQLFFLKLWNYMQESLRGSANDRLNELVRRLGFEVAARRLLKKGKRAESLLAALMLGHLRDTASWEALAEQAGYPDTLASLHAARAMTKIDPLKATEQLLPLFLTRADWGITQVASFLGESRQAFGLQLTKRIFTVNQQHWPRALQLANALRLDLPHKTMLLILARSRSIESLVAALHLVTGLPLLPTVRQFLHHPDSRVRVEVVRFLSSFGDETDILSLQQLLLDSQWWVRYQAAQALASMPFFGLEALQALRHQAPSTLVVDMLDHVLAERNGLGV